MSGAYIPAAGLHDMSPDHLTEALADFCKAESLTPASADELLAIETDPRRRTWLGAFLTAWELQT